MTNIDLVVVTLVNNDGDQYLATRKSLVAKEMSDCFHLVLDSSGIPVTSAYEGQTQNMKVLHLPPIGIYPTMNFAISWIAENIEGNPYIQFLNSGDEYSKDFIYSELDLKKDAKSVIYFPYFIFDPKTARKRFVDPKNWKSWHQLFAYQAICHQAIFVPLSIFKRYGLFDTQITIGADWDHIIRVSKYESFQYNPQIVINFVLGGHSSKNKSTAYKELFLLRKKHGPSNIFFSLVSVSFLAWQKFRFFLFDHLFERSDKLMKLARMAKGWSEIKP